MHEGSELTGTLAERFQKQPAQKKLWVNIGSGSFRKDRFEYQVTSHAYHDSTRLQEQFDQLFKVEHLKVNVVNEK